MTTTASIRTPSQRPSAPVAVRLLLLALLPLLAALLYWRGQHYDPALLDFKSAGTTLSRFLPTEAENWRRAESVRLFGKENLYEYINGHAEYFLSAGFRSLAVAEYRLPTDGKQPSAVVDLYDMGEPLNALGVLMDEMGSGQPIQVGDMGFQANRGVGFIAGPYYVKLAAFADGLPLLTVALAVRQALQKSAGPSLERGALDGLFPNLGTVTTTRFIKENYHGWSFLQRVVERGFQRSDGRVIQAFSVLGTLAQKRAWGEAFLIFFRQEGSVVTEIQVEGITILQIADRYEGDWILIPLERGWLGIFQPWDEGLQEPLKLFLSHG